MSSSSLIQSFRPSLCYGVLLMEGGRGMKYEMRQGKSRMDPTTSE